VLQGEKSLALGDEVYRYGLGDYLVISIELPVLSQVTQASKTTPLLGFGMAINPDRLKQVMGSASLVRSASPPDEIRGVAVNKAAPELLDASLRLLRLLDAAQDIPVLAPLIGEDPLPPSPASDRDHGDSDQPDRCPIRLAQEELHAPLAHPEIGRSGRHERVGAPSSVQGSDRDDADAVRNLEHLY
jgi:hypothetical protein